MYAQVMMSVSCPSYFNSYVATSQKCLRATSRKAHKNFCVPCKTYLNSIPKGFPQGAWVVWSVKYLTLDSNSGFDLRVVRSKKKKKKGYPRYLDNYNATVSPRPW